MSQSKLSSYYGTRKRRTDKLLVDTNNDAKISGYQDSLTNIKLTNTDVDKEFTKRKEFPKESTKLVNTNLSDPSILAQAPDVSKLNLKSSISIIKEPTKLTDLPLESTKLLNTKSSVPSLPTEAPTASKVNLKTSKSKIPRSKPTRTRAKKQVKVVDNGGQNADIRKSFQLKEEDNQVVTKLEEKLEIKPNKKSEIKNPSKLEIEQHEELEIKKHEKPEIKKPKKLEIKKQEKLEIKKQEKPEIKKQEKLEIELDAKLQDKPAEKLQEPDENETVLNSTYTITTETPWKSEAELTRTPKRNLSNPDAANADSKKKKKIDPSVSGLVNSAIMGDETPSVETPNKHSEVMKKHSARKNLFSDYRSDSLAAKDSKSNFQVKQPAFDADPKRPSISADKLDGLKARLSRLDQTFHKFHDFKSNKCKITSVIVPDDRKGTDATAQVKPNPVPCYVKHHSLVAPSATLALPYKYKLLSDSFRCSDTIVSVLNNRKEICTFDKLKSGVQDMTKRTFTRTHLGQIKTVFPHAYNYSIEKNSASVMNRKPGTPQYELVVAPDMTACNLDRNESVAPDSNSVDTSTKSGDFQAMTPAYLIQRKNVFAFNLLNIAKKHHQNFLAKLDPPVHVPMDKLTKWHPKFPVDSLPDIEPSELPEPPSKPKVGTALDLLNKIRGSAGERIEKALQAVVDKNAEHASKTNVPETKTTVTNKLLKNISTDLLQRIRARESVKIIEDMTKDPKDQKRKTMMERIPEFVRILRSYFITERRAAISLEDATQKIMDSYHSALNPEDIRQHLQLIADTFPKWLTLIPIRKGLFLKIDKNKDINVLLDSIHI